MGGGGFLLTIKQKGERNENESIKKKHDTGQQSGNQVFTRISAKQTIHQQGK